MVIKLNNGDLIIRLTQKISVVTSAEEHPECLKVKKIDEFVKNYVD